MFVVYSNRQMLPVIKEVEDERSVQYRKFQEDIEIDEKDDYYGQILEEIDEEYVKELIVNDK